MNYIIFITSCKRVFLPRHISGADAYPLTLSIFLGTKTLIAPGMILI
jgi:hypothetical protein